MRKNIYSYGKYFYRIEQYTFFNDFLAIHLFEVGPYNLYTDFILIESSHYLYNMSRLEFGVFLAPIRILIIDFSFCVDSKLVVIQAIIDSRQTSFTLVILCFYCSFKFVRVYGGTICLAL